jgi:hypothetical protein
MLSSGRFAALLCSQGRYTRCVLGAALLLILATGAAAGEGSEPEVRSTPAHESAAAAPPVHLFLDGPAALDALLKSLENPDFILLKGDEYRKLVERGEGPAAPKEPPAVVDTVAVTGTVLADRADFTVEFGITLRSPGPAWVPLRLDEQTVTGASEAERILPLKVAGGAWHVELKGAGAHRVRVGLKVLPRATVDGHRIDFAIPEAAATRFSWEIVDRVTEAATAGGELVEMEPIAAEGAAARTRLTANLTPRARLDVSWRVEAAPGAQLPPLLTIQGEIAIEIDSGSFRTESTWAVHAVRGTTRILELRLDPADEVLELELDGQPVLAGIEPRDGAMWLTIVLNDPLRPGLPKSLVMTTRRTIAATARAGISFSGFPLTNAKEQSGAIGIAQRGNLWVGGTAGRGLRRIDPRTELPPDLRTRPATNLAYVFADQPFELKLRIDPSPPLVRTDARTSITLDARQARVDTWLSFQPAHGRLFELAIGLPEGLELESVGPKEVVDAADRDPRGGGKPRVLTVRLTPQVQQDEEFAIHLTGRQTIDPSRPVELALFQPLDATAGGGRIAVLTDRNLTVDVRSDSGPDRGKAAAFRPAVHEPPTDWPWPADRLPGTPPALWLRQDGSPAVLPLAIDVHPRVLTARTRLRIELERRSVAIEQETECTVHFGTLAVVDVEVPASLQGLWEPEGNEVARRSELGLTPGGNLLTRLVLAREARDKVRLRFRIRLPQRPPLGPDRPVTLLVPWIRLIDAKPIPIQAVVASEPGVDVSPPATGWSRTGSEESEGAPVGEAAHPVRFILVSDGGEPAGLSLRATARPIEELPPVVASRLWLRTVQGPDYDVQTTAVFRLETRQRSVSVALPAGAELIRVKIDGKALSRVEALPAEAGLRLLLPEGIGAGPVLVELEYTLSASRLTGPWAAPRLLGGGFVQQTLWEVRVPWSRAVVGVPGGWTDENTWVWDRFSFRRRPRQSVTALAAWASGSSADSPAIEVLDDPSGGENQSFLFGRPGPPTELGVRIASRGALVGVCSGTVLVVGALLILVRLPVRPLACTAALGLSLACAALVEPSATALAVQSAMIGVVLTALTALMQRQVHRRMSAGAFSDTGGRAGARPGVGSGGSSVNYTGSVGSDESTAIRVRPVSSTVDHPIAATPVTPERESASGRSARRE